MRRFLGVGVAVLVAWAAFAAPAPEPFRRGWDSPENPHHDCQIVRAENALTMKLSGTDHDYDPRRECTNAPPASPGGRGRLCYASPRSHCRPALGPIDGRGRACRRGGWLFTHPACGLYLDVLPL